MIERLQITNYKFILRSFHGEMIKKIFGSSSKVVGNLRKTSEIFGKCSGTFVQFSKQFWKFFENPQKIDKNGNGFYIGKTKRRLHDGKSEHFKALAKNDNTSAIADHVKATGHNIKCNQFDILAKVKTDYHCKIKETLYIQELEPAFNVNVGSQKLMLY